MFPSLGRKPTLLSAALATVLAAAPYARSQAPNDPSALGQRFLAHLAANQPLAGEFRIETVLDHGQLGKLLGQTDAGGNKSVVTALEPERQLLVCRWAWADGKEVCEALPGSSNSMYGFLTLPEGNLFGYNPKQFNLTAPELLRADVNRPALFYFFNGGDHWKQFLTGANFSAGEGGKPDLAVIVAKNDSTKAVLGIEPKTGRLRRASISHNDQLAWSLTVEELTASRTDERAFPSKATVEVFGADGKRPVRRVQMTASRLAFPTPGEAAGQFKLPVPAKALIGDRVLNAAIELSSPADGAGIITGRVSPPRTPFTPTSTEVPLSGAKARWRNNAYLIVIAAALPLVGYGLYHIVRRQRNT